MSIKHDHTLHPITALSFYDNGDDASWLLAGEGPLLKIFDSRTSKLIGQCQIFEGQSIHGIAVQTSVSVEHALQIVIWGGSSLVFLTGADFICLMHESPSKLDKPICSASDWILDAAISSEDETSCVLVTANNTALKVTLSQTTGAYQIDELDSPSKSILYSAHLVWESSASVLVAAGTVFGEIIAWRCLINADGTSRGEILHTFSGHEGSIFGVHISPLITLPDKPPGRLLASCSDDRTIRVWDLAPGTLVKGKDQEQSVLRETGFGDNGQNSENHCVAVVMGHASRIWRVKFLLDASQPDLLNILSFGEDATTQQWSLTLESRRSVSKSEQSSSMPSNTPVNGNLVHQKTFAFHSGKHIWSTAVRQLRPGEYLIVTGGADGKITVFSIDFPGNGRSEPFEHKQVHGILEDRKSVEEKQRDWDLTEVLETLPHVELEPPILVEDDEQSTPTVAGTETLEAVPKKKKKKKKPKKLVKDAFNRYAFASESTIIVTTTFGRVLLGNFRSNTWKELSLPESAKDDLKSWSVVKSFPGTPLVFLAGTSGKIFVFNDEDHLTEIGKVEGKVADMFVVSDPTSKRANLIVTNLYATHITSFPIVYGSGEPLLAEPVLYELPHNFIVTSAGRIGEHMILGSRYGALAVYDAEHKLLEIGDSDRSLVGDAVTAIIPLPDIRKNSDSKYFLTTGRKGFYSIFEIRSVSSADQINYVSLVHQGSPPFGPMIENAWYSDRGELLLYGFKGKNFIVWNETQQSEIMSVECGGAHRSYSYVPTQRGGQFIYTKASRLYLYSQSIPSHDIIKPGGHGREIKACAMSADKSFIATGAEDTAIRIWSYEDSTANNLDNKFHCLAVAQKHTAGIQHLQWHGSTYLFSSGGNEEFFIWAVSPLPNGRIGVMCEAACPDQTEEQDLRIMSFDITELAPCENGETNLLISLAYSDSTIRVYTYSKDLGYVLVTKGRYNSSCLMQIRNLTVENGFFNILSAATDGNLTLWRGNLSLDSQSQIQDLAQISSKKVHQSSVKSLDISYLNDERQIAVATGGDDNSLAISIYQKSQLLAPTSSIQPRVFLLPSAHAAAVTAIGFVSKAENDCAASSKELKIVTSSNDQRVKEWRIKVSVDGEALQLRKAGDIFTPVADVGDLACLRTAANESGKEKVLIVGNGTEVWNVVDDKY